MADPPKVGEPQTIALSADGKRTAVSFSKGTMAVWETATGKLLWQSDQPVHYVSALFAENDRVIAEASTGQGEVPLVRFGQWKSSPQMAGPGPGRGQRCKRILPSSRSTNARGSHLERQRL